ncbi:MULTISPECIES: chromosomal replication initiator protein DnaA [unclassified Granulicatella]|uniref:chromosomal replication initiator protein DnaA n=1 Tax=unclassified Granulicatella TaxID=2630493 RepID=UPI0010734767|nr:MULTISPECIES: chromosomal replication initiator protein DnaA [unclassified Granulicatella]MBF0780921.1 chromosomal replication initiator protein DnaA [Granulicatella sp. 19428wC4_WM01]TFU93218.1 chromosomal replication initiator protein DnaA [Granulicatella sp. WM01]
MNTLEQIWENLTQRLKQIYAQHIYELATVDARPLSFKDNLLTITVKNNTQKELWEEWLINSAKSILNEHSSQADIHILLETQTNSLIAEATTPFQTSTTLNLNPNYTFDNFVVGEGSKMAHAAALAVSDAPGVFYNPLFIYGGSGLGKTHLMHAIGNKIAYNNSNALIRYVTSEDFVNEFTTAIRNGAMEQFKNNYRQVDLLLVDDIQFLAGKEQTLDEFFHTFNALYGAKKQIVLTSDRLASEIPQLPNRLVSRFIAGLSSDITPPDLETRTAILRKKANSLKIDITDDTIAYIAGQVNSNVRELEAALNRVNFYSVTNRSPITTALAAEALKGITSVETKKIASIYDIQVEVGKAFNLSVDQLRGKKRTKEIVIPRQIAMYLSREITQNSLIKIGYEFGGKDHTTVMHACEKIQQTIDTHTDLELISIIQKIKQKF